MATTAFPAVVAGIISQLGASNALTGVRIFDGIEILLNGSGFDEDKKNNLKEQLSRSSKTVSRSSFCLIA